ASPRSTSVPVSVEWTVPYGRSFLHLGVHNLSPASSAALTEEMAEYTANPRSQVLDDLLEELHSDPGVLVVLNHPLWDMGGIGQAATPSMVRSFLTTYHRQVHALETNGLRAWEENLDIVQMGQVMGFPVISGGDRHGCEANALINLTRATTMTEFVHEIRCER